MIDDTTTSKGQFDYYWTHALNSDETLAAIYKYCFDVANVTEECTKFRSKASSEMGNIDFYNIYAPICHNTSRGNGSPGSVSLH